ncbi:MAG: 16S rRNA (uracil(1498)-N(3))-methyltransferase [Clostridia bacterium]|jgi:16S rRNA (uracil1498-N3)-methyltransferase|nr:16S rRNA (uracil(1498)-N(3))-methyltransferase [Clostridia bacterium]
MHRFYVPPEDFYQDQEHHNWAIIKGQEFIHLSRVLRLLPGQEVTVFDGLGREYAGKIFSIEKDEAILSIGDSLLLPRESSLEVWLVQGIPKGEKMELIIQKATELGVRGIIPLKAQRCVVKLEGKKEEERRKRWQKVALEAVKQCRRALIPTVMPVCTMKELLQQLPPKRYLILPWEEGGIPFQEALKQVVAWQDSPDAELIKEKEKTPVYLIIGPEGGFTAEEVRQVQSCGGVTVSLGPRILRTETAGLAALSVLMFAWGDWV